MTTRLAMCHVLERISPKGEGQIFIGTCVMCGKTGLKAADALEYCDKPGILTEDEALVRTILNERK